jgi:phosphotransferase system enzyme I (PtsI)
MGVSPGVVAGPVARISIRQPLPQESAVTNLDLAGDQIVAALREVAVELGQRAEQAPKDVADILAAHVMILDDPVLADRMRGYVGVHKSRIVAIDEAFGEFKAALAEGGEYFAERIADLEDLQYRVTAALLGLPSPTAVLPDHPSVVVARDLGPADVIGLDLDRILAIVTEEGGMTSHTAIVAKSLGLPAVVACHGATALEDGVRVLVDGRSGSVIANPQAATVQRSLDDERQRRSRMSVAQGPGRTKDGARVQLLVNTDASYVTAADTDSEGVGLFRTEFLYVGRTSAPGHDEQRDLYREVFAAFAGRKVVIRTLDAGADKPLGFVDVGPEQNPALGVRGLRVSRRFPELLDVQLRAIASAANDGDADVWVMAPMVSTVTESQAFAAMARGLNLRTVGVMVEVPALALRAERVLEHCDFMSLGTNDLAQYTFAADRMLTSLADLVDPWQPALLELVRLTAGAGQRLGRPVGVCGEAASDPVLALVLVGLGVTSLSMSPVSLPDVRSMLREHDLETCQRLAEVALSSNSAAEARAEVRRLAGHA